MVLLDPEVGRVVVDFFQFSLHLADLDAELDITPSDTSVPEFSDADILHMARNNLRKEEDANGVETLAARAALRYAGDNLDATLTYYYQERQVEGRTINHEEAFGTFSVREKGERVGRNPKTGEEVPILPRRVLVFRASHVLKKRINGD